MVYDNEEDAVQYLKNLANEFCEFRKEDINLVISWLKDDSREKGVCTTCIAFINHGNIAITMDKYSLKERIRTLKYSDPKLVAWVVFNPSLHLYSIEALGKEEALRYLGNALRSN